MTDILIPLGQGSRHNNLELRYALRSIEKHLKGVGNVWVVGERPDFLTNVVHVPCQDSANNWNRAHNIYRKIMAGINTIGIDKDNPFGSMLANLSDNFLFMNDDHFLLQDYEAGEFPYYHRGQIELGYHVNNLPQHRQYINTKKILLVHQRKTVDFGVHCPIVYSKSTFRQIFTMCRWPQYGYEIKSVYGNCINVTPCYEIDDLKFHEPLMTESIYRVLEDRPWFSIGDRTLRAGDMKTVLQELYPTPSKYEL